MARNCSICSASDEIQREVLELHAQELSHQKMTETINDKFKTDLSSSAMGRHLKKCLPINETSNTDETIEMPDFTKINDSNVRETLRQMLFEGVQNLLARMRESVNEKTGLYDFHLETCKSMSLFIDMLNKLSPQKDASLRDARSDQINRRIQNFSDAQRRILYDLIAKKWSLRELRDLIDAEIKKEEVEEGEASQNVEGKPNLTALVSEEG